MRVGVFSAGAARTDDAGSTWSRVAGPRHPTHVAWARSAAHVVFALHGGAFLRSDDGGASWRQRGRWSAIEHVLDLAA